jgi:hypothetical protein
VTGMSDGGAPPTGRPCPLCGADNRPDATRCGACNFHLVDGQRVPRRELYVIAGVAVGLWLVALASVLAVR